MLIKKLLINDFPRKIKISNKRRRKYYDKSSKKNIPKKYLNTSKYVYKKFGDREFLIEVSTGEKVIANPRTADQPRYKTVSGQEIYSGNLHHHTRNKIMQELKQFFLRQFEINELTPFDENMFPLIITGELFSPYYEQKNNDWDVDNFQFPYVKAFHDALVAGRYIPEDHRGLISCPLHFKYTPSNDYKMRIKFEKDRRKIWNNHFGK